MSPEDVRQGAIGNCWMLAAAASIAEKPGRLERMFVNDTAEIKVGGIYGIDMYHLGVPTTVIVDDRLPIHEVNDTQ